MREWEEMEEMGSFGKFMMGLEFWTDGNLMGGFETKWWVCCLLKRHVSGTCWLLSLLNDPKPAKKDINRRSTKIPALWSDVQWSTWLIWWTHINIENIRNIRPGPLHVKNSTHVFDKRKNKVIVHDLCFPKLGQLGLLIGGQRHPIYSAPAVYGTNSWIVLNRKMNLWKLLPWHGFLWMTEVTLEFCQRDWNTLSSIVESPNCHFEEMSSS